MEGYFEYYENHSEARYISDGNPDVISLPEKYKNNLDEASLGDKELNIYVLEE